MISYKVSSGKGIVTGLEEGDEEMMVPAGDYQFLGEVKDNLGGFWRSNGSIRSELVLVRMKSASGGSNERYISIQKESHSPHPYMHISQRSQIQPVGSWS